MKCIDPLVTGYERGTFEERSARTESSPRQSRKNSEDDSRANNNIRETLGILSGDVDNCRDQAGTGECPPRAGGSAGGPAEETLGCPRIGKRIPI